MFSLLTLLTLIWQTLSYWSLWPPLPSPAAGGLFPCDPGADSRLFILCKMHLSYFQLLFPHVARLQPGEKSTFSEPGKVLSHLQTLVHLKEPQFLFLHPLVWFVSTGVKASITHGCIPKHSDQKKLARNIWCRRLCQNNKCQETLRFSGRNIKTESPGRPAVLLCISVWLFLVNTENQNLNSGSPHQTCRPPLFKHAGQTGSEITTHRGTVKKSPNPLIFTLWES